MQTAMGLSALDAGFVTVPRPWRSSSRATRRHREEPALACLLKVVRAGLGARKPCCLGRMLRRAFDVFSMVPLMIFGYGQGLAWVTVKYCVRSVALVGRANFGRSGDGPTGREPTGVAGVGGSILAPSVYV